MYPNTLRDDTRKSLDKIKKLDFLKDFYLAGGTALALQLGHRESVDLDFFTEEKFDSGTMRKELSSAGDYVVDKELEDTLDGTLDGVKISFFYHPWKWLYPFKEFEGVRIADERDITAMKISAVSDRGSRKDFIDIYFLMKEYSLEKLIAFFEDKYSETDYNKLHILKSLTYFEDASDPMPEMKKQVDWEKVKMEVKKEAKELVID